ncbi:MAG: hypothetical protein JNL74_17405 [Fibrobacteres bacterium]|nr:hypothetical protein [Fibrobacterota bacterium]
MIRSLIAATAIAGVLFLSSCTVDCEVCCTDTSGLGIKSCATANDVYESDCNACPEANSTQGVTCNCTVK